MLKNKINFILFLLSCFIFSNSSAQTFAWAKNISAGASTELVSWANTVDAAGNVYTLGTLIGQADFDPGPAVFNLNGNLNGTDVFVSKLDAAGNFLWAKLIAGSGMTYLGASDIALDPSGTAVLISGTFDGPVDFDPGTSTNVLNPIGDNDLFVLKLDATGSLLWVKQCGGFGTYLENQALAVDALGAVYTGGSFYNSVDFDPGPGTSILSSPGTSAYILKLDPTGNFVWCKDFSSTAYCNVVSINIDQSNHVICGGGFASDIDFDPLNPGGNNPGIGFNEIFYAKLSSQGNLIFARVLTGTNYKQLVEIKPDAADNLYMCGSFSDVVDFDPGSAVSNLTSMQLTQDVFALKLNSNGDFLWAKSFPGGGDEMPFGLNVDAATNLYVAGMFEAMTDFDPGPAAYNLIASQYDGFLVKLKPSGDFTYAHKISSVGMEAITDVEIANNSLYACGLFNVTVDFDPSANVSSLTSNASSVNGDGFNFKWDQCAIQDSIINAAACNYTLNGITYNSNGTYIQNYTNAVGCDSILTLHLSNSGSNASINVQVCGGTYTLNGQTYTNSGIYTQQYTGSNGCDSIITLNLNIGASSSYTLTETACDYYIFNNNFLQNSGVYTDTLVNSTGCDSVVTLNLTISNSYYNYIPVNSCGPYTFGGFTYSSSGLYTFNFFTSSGCDSMIDLDLNITPIPPTSLSLNSCSPIVFDNQTYAASGTYNHIMQSVDGCDSLIVLTISINGPVNTITQNGAVLTADQGSPATYQWVRCNPFTLIAGANSQSYTATANGDYAVIVNANSCADTSACKTVSNVALNDLPAAIASLFPNPVKDELTLVLANKVERLTYDLCTASGQKLTSGSMKNAQILKLNTEQYSRGLYFIKIFDGEKYIKIKFVKE